MKKRLLVDSNALPSDARIAKSQSLWLQMAINRQEASIMWCALFRPKFAQKTPKFITSHDVPEPLKLSASRDVIISGQIWGSKFERVFTLGDGCWLSNKKSRFEIAGPHRKLWANLWWFWGFCFPRKGSHPKQRQHEIFRIFVRSGSGTAGSPTWYQDDHLVKMALFRTGF